MGVPGYDPGWEGQLVLPACASCSTDRLRGLSCRLTECLATSLGMPLPPTAPPACRRGWVQGRQRLAPRGRHLGLGER